ncbi:MAG: ferredoxin-type protein NapF [Shimia sp.]|uniref:ferredoxin-type protein NapF n=1 Tax=Shimia sp. TaxID=1954381 RepID=UPI003B8E60E7
MPERRAFLRGRFQDEETLRPPGALELASFLETCTRCGDCAAECPQAIITADDDGFPKVDISSRGCTFCGACAEACSPEAIQPTHEWIYRAVVSDRCLSMQGVTCRACEDHCDESAIRFRLMTGGLSAPQIDPETCSGCGACVAPCPSNAITVERPALQQTASPSTASETNVCTISADA